MKKINLKLHDRIKGNHIIESEYSRQETINVFENMAYLLRKEARGIRFKRSKKFKLTDCFKGIR